MKKINKDIIEDVKKYLDDENKINQKQTISKKQLKDPPDVNIETLIKSEVSKWIDQNGEKFCKSIVEKKVKELFDKK